MPMYLDTASSEEGAPPMVTSSHIRWWELLGAVLGGLAWLVSVLVDSASAPQEPLFWLYAIAWLGTLGGLVGLYALQASSHLWLGISSFFAAFLGATLALAGTVLNLLSRGDLLQQGFYEQTLGLGLFITLLGVVVFGVGFTLLGVASLAVGRLWRNSVGSSLVSGWLCSLASKRRSESTDQQSFRDRELKAGSSSLFILLPRRIIPGNQLPVLGLLGN